MLVLSKLTILRSFDLTWQHKSVKITVILLMNERSMPMYKTIFSHIGKYRKQAVLTPVTIIGEVLMEVLIPAVMAIIIDNGVDKGVLNSCVEELLSSVWVRTSE